MLPYLGTRQAVEDLEAYPGAPRRRRPDALRRELRHAVRPGVCGGPSRAHRGAPARWPGGPHTQPVRLLRRAVGGVRRSARGHPATTAPRSAACTVDTTTPNALGGLGRPGRRARVQAGRSTYHGGTGRRRRASSRAAQLVNAGTAFLYSEYDRMLLQRALAAASQGDLWYLSRLLYAGLVIDPDTQEAIPIRATPTGCTTRSSASTTPSRATLPRNARDDLSRRRARAGHADRHMGDVFYGDLPCAFWPAQPETIEPARGPRGRALSDARAGGDARPGHAVGQRRAHRGRRRRQRPDRSSSPAGRMSSSVGARRAPTTW